ncbi:tetratricopeptide repeat protein [Sphingopyxis sp. QXT-31]|uniref:tetratricopeptide repeat protein n=1 Tax=Sphingopyxis sp. QXT-31 TaxID=1357916 RepID=UPI0018DC1848|nr:tetratricopeptide repeat protein [Sphingopyxis sp. QXT-31]
MRGTLALGGALFLVTASQVKSAEPDPFDVCASLDATPSVQTKIEACSETIKQTIGNRAALKENKDAEFLASTYAIRGFHKASIKDYEGAIADYLISIERGSKSPSVFYNLANAYRNFNKYEESIVNYKKSIELKPDYLWALINLGYSYKDLGDIDSAKVVISRAKKIDPDNLDVIHIDAILIGYSGDLDRSISEFGKIIAQDPKRAGAYADRGWSLYQLRRFDDAIRDFDKAISLAPANMAAYHNRAAVRLEKGDQEGGLADLNEALRLAPSNAKAVLDRALLFTRQGRNGEADSEFDRALRMNPSLAPHAYARRGKWWFDKQNYDRAEQDFGKLVTLEPAVADWVHLRGLARYDAGRVKEGIGDYDAAARMDPENPTYQNSRCWGRALAGLELDVALNACNQAIARSPVSQQRASFLDSRGRAHLARKEYADALSDYDAALLIAPKMSSALYGRGLARKQLNQPDGERDIREALLLDPAAAKHFSALDLG